jgi:hypothetical protein
VLRAVTFVAAAVVGYVLLRAAWVFLEWPGLVAVVVLVGIVAARRRSLAAGLAAGAAVSALALTL